MYDVYTVYRTIYTCSMTKAPVFRPELHIPWHLRYQKMVLETTLHTQESHDWMQGFECPLHTGRIGSEASNNHLTNRWLGNPCAEQFEWPSLQHSSTSSQHDSPWYGVTNACSAKADQVQFRTRFHQQIWHRHSTWVNIRLNLFHVVWLEHRSSITAKSRPAEQRHVECSAEELQSCCLKVWQTFASSKPISPVS